MEVTIPVVFRIKAETAAQATALLTEALMVSPLGFPYTLGDEPKRCLICRRALDQPGDPDSVDCGGDCAACVREAEGRSAHPCQRCGSEEWTEVSYSGCTVCRPEAFIPKSRYPPGFPLDAATTFSCGACSYPLIRCETCNETGCAYKVCPEYDTHFRPYAYPRVVAEEVKDVNRHSTETRRSDGES